MNILFLLFYIIINIVIIVILFYFILLILFYILIYMNMNNVFSLSSKKNWHFSEFDDRTFTNNHCNPEKLPPKTEAPKYRAGGAGAGKIVWLG